MDDHLRGLSHRRVVIVEPHDDSRALYVDYFSCRGIDAVAVPSAPDALTLVSNRPPDAVITCLRLPGMDGFVFCHAVKDLPLRDGVPVIGLSSSLSDYQRAVHDASFAAVLMKPFRPDLLLRLLQRALLAAPGGE
jgi:CheY-like chemotaxis protein